MSSQRPTLSVIITTLNEGKALDPLLQSLAAQTVLPDEVVICDGGSSDDTIARIEAFATVQPTPVRLLSRPGANISQGRNAAIAAASGKVIAVTDAGVRLDLEWLEKLYTPFQDPDVHTVAGFYRPEARTTFELALGATTLESLDEIIPERFAPSSRSVAFLKSAWETVGGYPEWLDYCEDFVFDILLVDRYGPFRFVGDALVHFQPRPTLGAFLRQYYRYARGDGKAGLNWQRQHLKRYVAYGAGFVLVFISLLLLSHFPLARVLSSLAALAWWSLACVVTRVRSPYRRLVRMWEPLRPAQKLQAALWVPIIRVAGDLAKAVGYPLGCLWRLKNHRRDEISWRNRLTGDPERISPGPSLLS